MYSQVPEVLVHYCCFCLLTKLCPTATTWTVAYKTLFLGFPGQGYWSGLSFPSPGELPYLGIELTSPALQADSLLPSHQGSPEHITRVS